MSRPAHMAHAALRGVRVGIGVMDGNGRIERRSQDRAEFLAAAREHSVAVARHLDRVAGRLRSQARPAPSVPLPGPARPAEEVPEPELGPALLELSMLLLADASL